MGAFKARIAVLEPSEFHHGACVGADEEAASAVAAMSGPGTPRVVAHPPESFALVSLGSMAAADEVRPRAAYLDRNRAIVSACDLLIACPGAKSEERRGGTWFTVRAARRTGKPVVIIWPDGTATEEGGK